MTGEPRGVAIRAARSADLSAVTDIYAHAVTTTAATFELVPPLLAEMAARHRAIVDAGFPYLVACDGGEVLGFAYASLYRARPAYRHTVEDTVYVAPDAQRRGIGRALLSALIAACEAQDLRQMIAVIGDAGNEASITLHRTMAFREAGRLHAVGRKFDRWIDSVLMQRTLGCGSSMPA